MKNVARERYEWAMTQIHPLAAIRLEMGFTQEKMGRRLNLSLTTIQCYDKQRKHEVKYHIVLAYIAAWLLEDYAKASE